MVDFRKMLQGLFIKQPKVKKVPKPGDKKPFDIKLYIQAVKIWAPDFWKVKMSYFFHNFKPVMKKSPDWFKALPNDEKASYGIILLGNILVITGIVLLFV